MKPVVYTLSILLPGDYGTAADFRSDRPFAPVQRGDLGQGGEEGHLAARLRPQARRVVALYDEHMPCRATCKYVFAAAPTRLYS
jgi:hypothetical protein